MSLIDKKSTADQLVELMFSWMEQKELCAEKLKKLAEELESLREKCNISECVGSSVSVLGAAALIGAGVATFFTAGAAAPLIGVAAAVCSGAGLTVAVVYLITEHLLSSDTMKEVQKTEKNSKETQEKIQKMFEQLKVEEKKVSSLTDPDEVDQRIMTKFVGAVARRSGVKQQVDFSKHNDVLFIEGQRYMTFKPDKILLGGFMVGCLILSFFMLTFRGGKKHLFINKQLTKQMIMAGVKETKQLTKQMSKVGVKTAIKGGAKVLGGVVGLAFELPEAIDNWRELIQNNHVTEASQSLRDTADDMLETCRKLRKHFDDLRREIQEMVKRQEEEEKERTERQQQERKEKRSREKNTLTLLFYLGLFLCICSVVINHRVNMMSSNPVQEKTTNQECYRETQRDQTHMNEHHDQTEQTGSDQQGGGGQGGGDQGDEERDEESDSEEEESDSEEEESDSEEETEDDERKQRNRKKKCHEKKGTQSKERGVSEGVMETETGQDINARNIETNNVDQQSNQETNHRPAAISLGLLNTRSLNNKPLRILQLITGNDLDVFLTTETWLQQRNAVRVLTQASPQNFQFNLQMRKDGRGGGVAIQFLNELQGRQIHFSFITTFEYAARVLQHPEWDQPVLIINLYYPPGYNQQQFRVFLNEFQRLLDEVFSVYNSIIVTGDFNIWVDQTRRSFTDEFDFLLLVNNLVQHVHEPTHQRGHTLDLVITRNVEISGLFVRNDNISDHYTVYFNARPESKDTKEKTEENLDQDEPTKRFKKREE